MKKVITVVLLSLSALLHVTLTSGCVSDMSAVAGSYVSWEAAERVSNEFHEVTEFKFVFDSSGTFKQTIASEDERYGYTGPEYRHQSVETTEGTFKVNDDHVSIYDENGKRMDCEFRIDENKLVDQNGDTWVRQ